MDRIMFDYSKLKGRIKEKCGTQKVFSERLGVTEATMTQKLNGAAYFSQSEILKSADILEIVPDKIFTYFFTQAVQ